MPQAHKLFTSSHPARSAELPCCPFINQELCEKAGCTPSSNGDKRVSARYATMMGTSSHDYGHLVARWRNVARVAGLRLRKIGESDSFPLFCMISPAQMQCDGIYLSSGIHGDEPAATEGLLAWAEKNASRLRSLPVIIFPCLNPWGLTQNRRSTATNVDLNRTFHDAKNCTISAIQSAVGGRTFRAALMLHEDFDAEGVYLYELKNREPWGDEILSAAELLIPRDERSRIEKRRASAGIVSPRFCARTFEKMGLPEAVWLYVRGCRRSITFETPSEFALERRVAAQVAAIERFVELALASK
jgi:murein peptide amidase A